MGTAQSESLSGILLQVQRDELALKKPDGELVFFGPDSPTLPSTAIGQDLVLDGVELTNLGTRTRVDGYEIAALASRRAFEQAAMEAFQLDVTFSEETQSALSGIGEILEEAILGDAAPIQYKISIPAKPSINEETLDKLKQYLSILDEAYAEALINGNKKELLYLTLAFSEYQSNINAIENVSVDWKTIYGFDNNVSIHRLDLIAEQARSIGGLVEKAVDEKPFCTAFLVADGLLMTAYHCLDESQLEADELQVWFDFVGGQNGQSGSSLEPVKVDVTRIIPFVDQREKPLTDIALIEIAEEQLTGDKRRPLCFAESSGKRNLPVYSLGFPLGQAMKYHSNGRIYLPFKVKKTNYASMYRSVYVVEYQAGFARLRYDILTNIVFVMNQIYQIANHDIVDVMERIDAAYKDDTEVAGFVRADPDTRYHLGIDGTMPVMGMSIDLSKGNSGAPILRQDSKNQCVVGVMSHGVSDRKVAQVSYLEHERAIPVEAVLFDVEASYGEDVLTRVSN